MKRREFIKKSTLTTGLLSVGAAGQLPVFGQSGEPQEKSEHKPGCVPKRRYGKTDVMLSVIAFGGIVVRDVEQSHADHLVAKAYERGVNYFDVAPLYGDAEIKLGPALKPYRNDVFLSCKTLKRDYDSAKADFERSLERLKTEYFDLYQMHAISDIPKDVDAAFAEDGVMKLLLEEKKQGRIRYLGFSAHSAAAALTALNRYPFDSVMFPINFAEYYKGNFSPEFIAFAQNNTLPIIALKILARQLVPPDDPIRKQYPKCWYQPITDPEEAKLSMAFTLSQPGVVTAIPPGDERLFTMALNLLPELEPMTAEKTEKLKALAAKLDPVFKKET